MANQVRKMRRACQIIRQEIRVTCHAHLSQLQILSRSLKSSSEVDIDVHHSGRKPETEPASLDWGTYEI